MDQETQAVNDAIINMLEAYKYNLPDALEVILQITFRELHKHGVIMQDFRDMAHEIIDLT